MFHVVVCFPSSAVAEVETTICAIARKQAVPLPYHHHQTLRRTLSWLRIARILVRVLYSSAFSSTFAQNPTTCSATVSFTLNDPGIRYQVPVLFKNVAPTGPYVTYFGIPGRLWGWDWGWGCSWVFLYNYNVRYYNCCTEL